MTTPNPFTIRAEATEAYIQGVSGGLSPEAVRTALLDVFAPTEAGRDAVEAAHRNHLSYLRGVEISRREFEANRREFEAHVGAF